MNLLITGGKGSIGSLLAEALIQKGHSVDTFDLVNGQDLLDKTQLDKAIRGKDVAFHLAAVADLNWARDHSRETMDINITGTINVAEACSFSQVPLYYASTCCVYGNQKTHPEDESTNPNPSEIYACTKLAGENIIKGYGLLTGLRYNLMRFATVYGERMRPELGVYVFFKQALKGEPITVHGDGRQTRTFTYIGDLIDGIVKLFESGLFLGAVNLTTEEEVSALYMAKQIKALTKSKSEIIFIPQRPGQTYRESISAAKAKKAFGWQAGTTFQNGLLKTHEWLKQIPRGNL